MLALERGKQNLSIDSTRRLGVDKRTMNGTEHGLLFAIDLANAAGAALLVRGNRPDQPPRLALERLWSRTLMKIAVDLWQQAESGVRGTLVSGPVLALVAELDGQVGGLLCVALPPSPTMPVPACIDDLCALARLLTDTVLGGPRPRVFFRITIQAIHNSPDPGAVVERLFVENDGNLSGVARSVGVTRKTVYSLIERYKVKRPDR